MDVRHLATALRFVLPVLDKADLSACVVLSRDVVFAVGPDQTNVAHVPGAWFRPTVWSRAEALFCTDLFTLVGKYYGGTLRVEIDGLIVTVHFKDHPFVHPIEQTNVDIAPAIPRRPQGVALVAGAAMARASRKQVNLATKWKGWGEPDSEWHAVPDGAAWCNLVLAGETVAWSLLPRGGRAAHDRQLLLPGTETVAAAKKKDTEPSTPSTPSNDNAVPGTATTETVAPAMPAIPSGITPAALAVLRLAKALELARGRLQTAEAKGDPIWVNAAGNALATADRQFWLGWESLDKEERFLVSQITQDEDMLGRVLADPKDDPAEGKAS